MKLFQSDNIWKRQARAKQEALNPPTPHEKWKQDLRSNSLWLLGGMVLEILYIIAIFAGAASWDLTSIAVVVVVGLYCVYSAKQIAELKKNEPELTKAEKKKKK